MSKKKTLLEEGTIRRFQKLAGLASLSDGFVKKNSKALKEGLYEDDSLDDIPDGGDELGGEHSEPDGDDMGGLPDGDADDVGMDTPSGPIDGPAPDIEETIKKMLDVITTMASEAGVDMTVSGGSDDAGVPAPVDDLDLDAPPAPGGDVGSEPIPGAEDDVLDEEQVARITEAVVRRLRAKKLEAAKKTQAKRK